MCRVREPPPATRARLRPRVVVDRLLNRVDVPHHLKGADETAGALANEAGADGRRAAAAARGARVQNDVHVRRPCHASGGEGAWAKPLPPAKTLSATHSLVRSRARCAGRPKPRLRVQRADVFRVLRRGPTAALGPRGRRAVHQLALGCLRDHGAHDAQHLCVTTPDAREGYSRAGGRPRERKTGERASALPTSTSQVLQVKSFKKTPAHHSAGGARRLRARRARSWRAREPY